MRLRNVPRAEGVIEASEFAIKDPISMKGCWNELFGNDNPIHIEIGMGKGRFIMGMAKLHPDINYVGIERQKSVIFRAVEKIDADPLPNVRLIMCDAEELPMIFEKDEVDRIYLNFSDPWPKDRHANRRLTSHIFLDIYKKFLKADGVVAFKTDNRPLFDWSLISVVDSGWKTKDVTFDLHNSEYMEGNVMTEYEERFSAMGNPICRGVFYR